MMSRHAVRAVRRTLGRLLACLLAASGPASADIKTEQTITPNFKDAEITQIAESVSAVTGKNFIFDPHVHAQVTMLASKPLSPQAFYEAFLSILQVYGFVAVPAGDIIKIVPDANARQFASVDLPDHINPTSDEIVTQVIDVKNVAAAQLVPILRPMLPQYAHLAAYAAGNVLIVSDRASNVNRILRIVRRIDQVGDQDVEIVSLENASATETARLVSSLFQQAAAQEGAQSVKVVADDRSNSVVISGDQSQRLRVRALVAHLDTPLQRGGDTRVRYLRFANAEKIAPKLKEQVTGIAQASAGGGSGGGQASPQAQAEKNAIIWADPETNALVITAPPKMMSAIMEIIDKIDIRRAQVLVEAVIAEVNADKTSDLGVNWAAWSSGSGTSIPVGGFIEPVGGSSLADLYTTATGISSGSTSTSTSSLTGTTLGIGKISANGINFAAVLKALSGDANTNIVATPSAITLDNQEAELKVAQEVPIITGSYSTSTGTSSSSSVNPFTTVQRQEVGTILKVTPQIASEGNSVVLKISVESSSVASTSVSSVDITTNKRTVSTNLLVDDGGIVVLGGLISDTVTRSEQRVPLLGSLPLVGFFFKTRDYSRTRNNLMVFIRPKILRTPEDAVIETGAKYNYMQEEERKSFHKGVAPLLPHELPPVMPNLPPATTAPVCNPSETDPKNGCPSAAP